MDQEEVEKLNALYHSQVPNGFTDFDNVAVDRCYKRLLAIGMKCNYDYISHLMNHYQRVKFNDKNREKIYKLEEYFKSDKHPQLGRLKGLNTFETVIPSRINSTETVNPYKYAVQALLTQNSNKIEKKQAFFSAIK